MTPRKIVVFLGPSLPLDQARRLLDAIYLPPAGQADLISALTTHQPDVIALIDGVFLQQPAVWHKEILLALARGVRVYGASSMGALRAAETAAYGMIGIGEVYRRFASGELVDDDEVALAHGDAASGWCKLSEPMVNLRATFAAAHAAGMIDADTHAKLIAAAKALYFPERTFAAIFAALATSLPKAVLEGLRTFVTEAYVDVKRADAIALLATLRDLPSAAPHPAPTFRLAASRLHEALYDRDRTVAVAVGQQTRHVPLVAVARYAALHHPDFAQLNFHALNRALVELLGEILGVCATPEEVAREGQRFCARHGLEDEGGLAAWLLHNHLDEEEWRALMAQGVTCRKLQRSLLVGLTFKGSTRLVLDELRLRGELPQLLEQTAIHEQLIETSIDHEPLEQEIPLSELVIEHLRENDLCWEEDPITWSEEAGFSGVDEFHDDLRRARRARRLARQLLANRDRGQ